MEGKRKINPLGADNSITQVDAIETPYDHITARNQRESRLLQLPAEIRNSIYDYALGGNVFDVSTPSLPADFQRGLPKYSVALPRTCRQIHAETSLMVFATNTFYIDTWYAGGGKGLAFLTNRSAVEHASVHSCFIFASLPKFACRALAIMPNHRTLQISYVYRILVSIDQDHMIVLYEKPKPFDAEHFLQEVEVWLKSWKPEAKLSMRQVKNLHGILPWKRGTEHYLRSVRHTTYSEAGYTSCKGIAASTETDEDLKRRIRPLTDSQRFGKEGLEMDRSRKIYIVPWRKRTDWNDFITLLAGSSMYTESNIDKDKLK